jgi:indolepyruvate ferredoxin oxidoreductase
MTGMAQKGGAVFSHLKIAATPDGVHAVAIGSDDADLLLGCDLIVAGSRDALRSVQRGRTRVVMNTHLVPTGAFQRKPDMDFQVGRTIRLVQEAAGTDRTSAMDATAVALAYTGNALSANMILVGCAYQLGTLPLSRSSIEKAIELNGVSIELTKRSFALGRLYAHDPASFAAEVKKDPSAAAALSLDDFIARRISDLTAYQNAAYARRYQSLLTKVADAEARVTVATSPNRQALTDAVVYRRAPTTSCWPTRTNTRSRACTPMAASSATCARSSRAISS